MIFFDIDGTLIDFKQAEAAGIRTFYQTYGHHFTLTEEAFHVEWRVVGACHFPRFLRGELSFEQQQAERVKSLFELAAIRLTDREAGAYFGTYLQAFESSWAAYDDVVPCLQVLQAMGHRLGIISNGNGAQQRSKLERAGLLAYFEAIVVSSEAGAAKPDPRIFEAACLQARRDPSACLYIGDDVETDIVACRQYGLSGIWLNRTGTRTEHKVPAIARLSELDPELAFL